MNNNLFDRITESAAALIIFPPIFCIVPGFILLNIYNLDVQSALFWIAFMVILFTGVIIERVYKKATGENHRKTVHLIRSVVVVGYLALTAWLGAISAGGAVLTYVVSLIALICAVMFYLARPGAKA